MMVFITNSALIIGGWFLLMTAFSLVDKDHDINPGLKLIFFLILNSIGIYLITLV